MPIKLNGITIIDDTLKANTDLSNVTKPYVIETYVNGTSWYRVWSDGWCEQGGYITRTSQSANDIVLLKKMSNSDYTILATPQGQNAGGDYDAQFITFINKSVNGFTLTNSALNGFVVASGMSWEVKGYIQVGD